MEESKPPRHDPIVPLEYRSARPAAAPRAVKPIPVLPVAGHMLGHGHKSSATRLKWILGALVLLAVTAYLLHTSANPKRALAWRSQCAANLKTIGTVCDAYSNDHAGKYPAGLEEMILTTGVSPDIVICPATYDTPAEGTPQEQAAMLAAGGHVSYIWLGKELSSNSRSDAVLAYEPLSNHDNAGIHVLFNDYHVEWLDEADAKKLIDSVIPGEPTIWPAGDGKP